MSKTQFFNNIAARNNDTEMLIYLIGYMGAGKTTYGKRLARDINYHFIDLDQKIEAEQGKTIADIFAERGEDGFRQIEREAMTQTFGLENTIVATGGGTPCFFDNMQQLNAHGATLYIEMTPKSLVWNLMNSHKDRPLLHDKTYEELVDYVSVTLEKRLPFYTQAKYVVNGIGITSQTMIDALKDCKL